MDKLIQALLQNQLEDIERQLQDKKSRLKLFQNQVADTQWEVNNLEALVNAIRGELDR
jgi:peptidoglycan hydrolase CwlO-like protein